VVNVREWTLFFTPTIARGLAVALIGLVATTLHCARDVDIDRSIVDVVAIAIAHARAS
jgi:hypothetical protein